MNNLKTLFLLFLCLWQYSAFAQSPVWPDPETEQLYNSGRDALAKGFFNQAITAYSTALRNAPEIAVLRRDLAQAYYFSKAYENAYNTIAPLLQGEDADAQSYNIAAASLSAQKNFKLARRVLARGLERYPRSGALYFESGRAYDDAGEPGKALKEWVDGTRADPAYHVNYYEAAKLYAKSNEPFWALLYAEIFVNLERQTPRSADARKLLFNTYASLFEKGSALGKAFAKASSPFELAFYNALQHAAPVMIDGATAENLTMLRTRIAMEWETGHSAKLPHALFSYWSDLLREGHFDAYNQWMFGKAANDRELSAWKAFHAEATPAMESRLTAYPLRPSANDAYNTVRTKDLFDKD